MTSVYRAISKRVDELSKLVVLDEFSSLSIRVEEINFRPSLHALRNSANNMTNIKRNLRLSSIILRNIETANRSEALKSAI